MKVSLCATAKKNNKKIQANANAEKRFDASDLRVSDLLFSFPDRRHTCNPPLVSVYQSRGSLLT